MLTYYILLTQIQKKVVEASKSENYGTTGWQESMATAVAATPSPSSTNLDTIANLKTGMAYKAMFLSLAMGSMTQTTEVGRVLEISPDKQIILEATVCTAAKYGDTFRPVTRRTFEVLAPNRTRVKTVAAVVFISSVNGMIKGMIQKGAIQGMRDSFAKVETVMSDYAKVRPYEEGTGVTLGLPPSAAVVAGIKQPSQLRNAVERVVGTAVVEALDPWASFIYAALAHLPFLSGMTADAVVCVIVAFFSFEIVRACLLVLKFCASAGRHPQDSLSWISYYIFQFVHVPQSVTEVFTTVSIAIFAREVMAKFASFLPQPPSSGSRPPSAAGMNSAENSEGQSGVKYDGYGQAIADTNNNYVGKGNKALEALDGKSEVALDAIRQGLVQIGKLGQSNRAKARQHRQDKREKIAEKVQERRQQHAQNRQKGGGGGGGSNPVSPTSDVAAVAAAAAADWSAEGMSPSPSTAAVAPATALSGTSSPPSPGDDIASPRSDTASQYDPQEAALLDDPHNLSTEGYSGPELSPRLRSCAVVESLFENERLQPFRGWGHTWPGHFLPTDRVLHWSTNDPGEEPDSVTSQQIKDVAPLPPPGWRWVEAKWHLDLSGVFSDSTDNDGWSYGLDFPWVLYPFIPGTGRKKIADFVRRRRWLRTRVPLLIEIENEVENVVKRAVAYVEGAGSSTAHGGEEVDGTLKENGGASSGESGGNSSSSGSGSTSGGFAEALQQSVSRPFGSAVEELELLASNVVKNVENVVEHEKMSLDTTPLPPAPLPPSPPK
jgi:Integral peroxisomal membrane peroxin